MNTETKNDNKNERDTVDYLVHITEVESKECYKEAKGELFVEQLAHLKLQKLFYFCQGFYFAMYKVPLFDEDIKVWKYGPGVAEVYHSYKEHGPAPTELDKAPELGLLSNDELGVIDEVHEKHGQLSAWKLRKITHEPKSPWHIAKRRGHDIIEYELMIGWFSKELR